MKTDALLTNNILPSSTILPFGKGVTFDVSVSISNLKEAYETVPKPISFFWKWGYIRYILRDDNKNERIGDTIIFYRYVVPVLIRF